VLTVLNCLGAQHDLRLVALALAICGCGVIATLRLVGGALQANGLIKMAWLFLASIVSGTAIWSTHFVSMLAYEPGVASTYDPVLTMVSLFVAVAGSHVGLTMASIQRRGQWPVIGGAIFGLAIAAMHYLGMLADRLEAIVRWKSGFVATSILFAMVLTAGAMAAMRLQFGQRFARIAAPLLFLAIVSVHFTAMAALVIVPGSTSAHGLDETSITLAVAIGLAALLVVAAGSFAQMIDRRTRQEASARIDTLRLTDSLTGLPNRRAFDVEVAARIAAARPSDRFLIVAVKLTGFAQIVELHSRSVGERAVEVSVNRIMLARNPDVLVARTSTAEFMAIGPAPEPGMLHEKVEAIAAMLGMALTIDEIVVQVDPRIGAALFPGDAEEPEALIQCSRVALARAKADPLEPIAFYDESSDMARRRRQGLVGDLRAALESCAFAMVYQPQVRIETGQTIGYEALLRWHHPRLGPISPAEFIPLAEATGLIVPIGDWALQTACRDAAAWDTELTVAVNVSPLQLRQSDLPERIQQALFASGLAPARLEIELTESLLLDDRDEALQVLRRIRALGVRLALDDFGTGYSSLDVLRHFPFDKIKLDKTFVNDIETNPQSRAILVAMLAMGRSLAIPVLVEGVETAAQLAMLRAEGCTKVQGFLTGHPIRAADIADHGTGQTEGLAKILPFRLAS
jgi:predicted signal transduction protein with EAL and GGDEF domain